MPKDSVNGEAADQASAPKAIDKNVSSAQSVPRLIHGLMVYYMVLLIASILLIALMVWLVDFPPLSIETTLQAPERRKRLLVVMGFLVTGATIGSVLYEIRMIFGYYTTIYYDLTGLLIKRPTARLTVLPTHSNFIKTISFARETETWRGWASRRKFSP